MHSTMTVPSGGRLASCPPWCATDHRKDRNGRHFHSSQPRAVDGRRVWLSQAEVAGESRKVEVVVDGDLYFSPVDALNFAGAIIAACETAERAL
jgi:hypothetical protein